MRAERSDHRDTEGAEQEHGGIGNVGTGGPGRNHTECEAGSTMKTAMRRLWVTRQKFVLTLAAAVLIAVVGIASLLVLLGRGADSTSEDVDVHAMLEGRPVAEGIAAAGGSCKASGAIDRRNCMLDGVGFQLAEGTWVRQAGERERECSQGQASRETKVLTNRSWMIYADEPAELERVQASLSSNGVASKILGYCDWDE